jgi:TonB family protein
MPVARTATTNSLGRFLVGNLSPDSYELTITQQGFRTLRVFSVVVSATESPTFTLRLDLGALTETVEVRGSAAAVSAAGVAAGQTSPRARQVAEYFDAAKYYYEQGRLSEAESMMVRALDELRASMSQAAVTIGPIAEPQGPIRAGGEINLPKLLFRLEPAYPADALAAGVQGMVYIDAVLAKDGTVKDARVISGHPMLTDAALAAVHQWRYTPTKLNGVPVEVVMTVFVNFRRR